MNIRSNSGGGNVKTKTKTKTKTTKKQSSAKASKAPQLTAAGRKKINTTDSASLSGEKKGSQPINFASWGDNLKSGRADGNSAKQLQKTLNGVQPKDSKNPKLAEDGKFGANTQEAVKKFQQEKGLKVDGVVGKYTRAALEREQTKGSKDPNTQIPSGGIDDLKKAVTQQQQSTADKAAGQRGGGLNQLRGADPAKANPQDRATSIPSGESAEFPKPGFLQRVQENTIGRPSATVNPVTRPPAPPVVESVGPIPLTDGLPGFATGA